MVMDVMDKQVGKTSKIVIRTSFRVPVRSKSNRTLKTLWEIVELLLADFSKDEVDWHQLQRHAV
jgi:hypothetical protein